MNSTALIQFSILSFILGMFTVHILQEIAKQISKYREMKEKLEQFEREQNKCPHGYIDWDDCPDCCH